MGIRVHKVIGYGLTDIKHKGGKITDPRFNMDRIDALRFAGDEGDEEPLTVARFWRWVICNRRRLVKLAASEGRRHRAHIVHDHHMDEGLFLMHYIPESMRKKRLRGPARFEYLANKELSFYEAVIRAHEFGCPNVMVFQPFSCIKEWTRFDNIIDYVEESAKHNSRARWHTLRHLCGIYPYIGTMVRVSDPPISLLPTLYKFSEGAECTTDIDIDDSGLPMYLSGGFYNQLIGRWDKKLPPIAEGDFLKHLIEDWRPTLPLELLWILTYMGDKGCFNDVEAIKKSLQPMLYVYWC